jgi:type II pantothenate kinase
MYDSQARLPSQSVIAVKWQRYSIGYLRMSCVKSKSCHTKKDYADMFDSSRVDVSGVERNVAAIDFGASNTDAAAVMGGKLRLWSERRKEMPSVQSIESILHGRDLDLGDVDLIAVTGGHHQILPFDAGGVPIVKVGELAAIGRGGQALATGSWKLPEEEMLIVSAGSGTAIVAARAQVYQHVTGTGVGGGTLIGLGRLLLGIIDPVEINRLAREGSANHVDLALRDLVSGPIGSLPADATAVNFGRVARSDETPSREDLAAALVNMLGQVIATLATNAARAAALPRGVVTGHMTDMDTVRDTIANVGRFFGFPLETCSDAGYATVIGALLRATQV